MATEAERVTGITTEVSHKFGVYPTAALYLWDRLAQMASTVVAHNIRFDWEIMQMAWCHHNPAFRATPSDFLGRHDRLVQFCTMEAATNIVNLPPTARMLAAGIDKPKPPKLIECMKHFFGEDMQGAHDAMNDVRATARLYFHLQSLSALAA